MVALVPGAGAADRGGRAGTGRLTVSSAAQRPAAGEVARRVVDALFAEGRRVAAERLAVQTDLDALQSAAATIAASGFAVAGYVSDAVRRRPYPGLCAYIAANAAAAVDGQRGHDQERAIQTAWLRDRLALDAGS